MLTEQEIEDIADVTLSSSMGRGDLLTLARAIEQAATAPLLARIAELEAKLDEGAQAVRWAPSSAHWSNELRRIFGPDSRSGIDALEAQLREAQKDAERYRRLRNNSDDHGLCAVRVSYWSEEYGGQAAIEVFDGKHLDAEVDAATKENKQ